MELLHLKWVVTTALILGWVIDYHNIPLDYLDLAPKDWETVSVLPLKFQHDKRQPPVLSEAHVRRIYSRRWYRHDHSWIARLGRPKPRRLRAYRQFSRSPDLTTLEI